VSQAVLAKAATDVIRNILPADQHKYASVLEFNSGRLQNDRSVPVDVGLVAHKFRIPGF